MLISVIIPTCNSEKYLAQTLKSALNQTYRNIEIIVVDDSSKDKTVSIINKFIKIDKRIKLIKTNTKKPSGGPAFPRNLGISFAKGNYVAFLDSDDLWKKNKLELQVASLKKNHLISFTNCKYIVENKIKNETYIRKKFIKFTLSNLPESLLLYNPIRLSTVLIKKTLLEKKKFNEESEISGVEDMEMWLNYSLKKFFYKYNYLSDNLVFIRKHKKNLTKNYNLTVIKNIYCISKYMINNKNIKKIHFFILGIFFRFFLIFSNNYKFIILKYVRSNAFVFIFLFLLLFYTPIPDAIGDKLIIKHRIENSVNSLVIVSGDGDYDKKIKSYEKTFLDAQYLIKHNYVKNIYLIGNYNLIPENQIIASLLIFANYNKENIIFSDINSISTYENIKKVALILNNNKDKNIIYITEKYRTKRAYLIWSKLYPDINVKMYYGEYPEDKWIKIKKITYELIAMMKNYLLNWI